MKAERGHEASDLTAESMAYARTLWPRNSLNTSLDKSEAACVPVAIYRVTL